MNEQQKTILQNANEILGQFQTAVKLFKPATDESLTEHLPYELHAQLLDLMLTQTRQVLDNESEKKDKDNEIAELFGLLSELNDFSLNQYSELAKSNQQNNGERILFSLEQLKKLEKPREFKTDGLVISIKFKKHIADILYDLAFSAFNKSFENKKLFEEERFLFLLSAASSLGYADASLALANWHRYASAFKVLNDSKPPSKTGLSEIGVLSLTLTVLDPLSDLNKESNVDLAKQYYELASSQATDSSDSGSQEIKIEATIHLAEIPPLAGNLDTNTYLDILSFCQNRPHKNIHNLLIKFIFLRLGGISLADGEYDKAEKYFSNVFEDKNQFQVEHPLVYQHYILFVGLLYFKTFDSLRNAHKNADNMNADNMNADNMIEKLQVQTSKFLFMSQLYTELFKSSLSEKRRESLGKYFDAKFCTENAESVFLEADDEFDRVTLDPYMKLYFRIYDFYPQEIITIIQDPLVSQETKLVVLNPHFHSRIEFDEKGREEIEKFYCEFIKSLIDEGQLESAQQYLEKIAKPPVSDHFLDATQAILAELSASKTQKYQLLVNQVVKDYNCYNDEEKNQQLVAKHLFQSDEIIKLHISLLVHGRQILKSRPSDYLNYVLTFFTQLFFLIPAVDKYLESQNEKISTFLKIDPNNQRFWKVDAVIEYISNANIDVVGQEQKLVWPQEVAIAIRDFFESTSLSKNIIEELLMALNIPDPVKNDQKSLSHSPDRFGFGHDLKYSTIQPPDNKIRRLNYTQNG